MNRLRFEGKGFEFFKIHFTHTILTFLSLTILYPWAKIREYNYLYPRTYLSDTSFLFRGTTREFFKGYIRSLLAILFSILIAVTGIVLAENNKESILTGVFATSFYLLAVALIYLIFPVILHGSLNFHLNNTSWGSISPSYSGKLSEFVPQFFTGMILSTLTLGLYQAWFRVKLNKYILGNLRFGNLRFDFSGDVKTLFRISLKGFLLSIITLGIYGIWFYKEIFEYKVNNIVVKKDDQEFKLHSNANTLEVFEMLIGNILLVSLTFGIGYSWAYMRYYRFILCHCIIPADFNIHALSELQEPERIEITKLNWLDKWNPVLIA